MIKKSTVQRIVFFIAISVSYLSYRVVTQAFYEKKITNEAKDFEVISSVKSKKSLPFKHFDDGSMEAPYASSIENTTYQSNSYSPEVHYSQKAKKSSTINIRQRNAYITKSSRSGAHSKTKSSGGGGNGGGSQDEYATGNGSDGGGSGGGGDAGGVASSGGGSGDGLIIDNIGGMGGIGAPSFTASITTESDIATASNANGFARLGITTTPSVGGANPTTQGGGTGIPPPPPGNPAPLDTNSVIFILMGAAFGVYILLKDQKKKSQVA